MVLRIIYLLMLLSCFLEGEAQKETVQFFLTPSISEDALKGKGLFVKDFLERETGLAIQLQIPKSYDDLIEKFGSQPKSFAIMSSQSYVLARSKYGAIVKLRTVRFGHSVYQGMIVTHVNSGIKNLKHLKGKTIAYTDVLSTSGYLYPKKLLEKNNIEPGNELFLKTHDEIIKQVYERKVDAGAAFYSPPSSAGEIRDARKRLSEKYPDVMAKVIILETTDPIPNDPIVFTKEFDPSLTNKICMALLKLSMDDKGKQVLTDLYGLEGFVKASDADYSSLRNVMGVQPK
jgi:phosphonate transport system substrate-binding protein